MAKLKEGSQVTLTSLQKKIVTQITLPMLEECPTALRYALAKYDAMAVAEAYEAVYDLWQGGEIVAE